MEEKPQAYWKKIDFILLHTTPYYEVLIVFFFFFLYEFCLCYFVSSILLIKKRHL